MEKLDQNRKYYKDNRWTEQMSHFLPLSKQVIQALFQYINLKDKK